ncbi:DEAD/DEAH box helicase [Escherichia coli]|uniref:DNA 3'-5' helicase II n=1 Tax=Escherichia coli TaxID=562 RepID=A0A7L7EJG4_ECOLX|nr:MULTISPECIES: ATP-binding domain-containing protein [Escherichia]EBB6053219.1 helicase [Salmonella enterica]EEX2836200.1 ATP-binding domain-containing protein [Escherichia albertii]HBT9067228.1 ATP-binding domain-containing protein [Klebsiella pneumoniae]EFB1110802.1 helicase [Escherichia coli]EFF4888620.1 ATP-binding domain-containing protein [Escherichia coli]
MNEKISITRGVNEKPVATDLLGQRLEAMTGIKGVAFTGYPLIATPDGKYSIDATLISPDKGIVLFDLIEGRNVGNYAERQDDLANKIEARLKLHRELVKGRNLLVPLSVISFAPAIENTLNLSIEGYPLVNEHELAAVLNDLNWPEGNDELYRMTVSAIESLSSIRKSRSKREIIRSDSRGAKLKLLEDSIATLDHRQNKAVIETIEGVQRIRGLAGSGKTIVLALKAAYLHTQYPNWRIAVTFHTRSLKGQFRRLINNFCIEQSGEEPDWTKIRIINAWGAPGGDSRDGIYYEYCRATGTQFLDFNNAALRFGGGDKAFDGVCQEALGNVSVATNLYDVILVDEAQDFAPSFLKLCYSMLKQPKRLVYAYDELQNLSGTSLPPPEDIFGSDEHGQPLVTFGSDRKRDVILQKCYRNSRPVLVAAHGLGFGIYRNAPQGAETGLVQMFDYPALWEEIGYQVQRGQLSKGQHVVLERPTENSPRFLEEHSDINDLVQFIKFENEEEQNAWLVQQVKKNLDEDELRHDDIVIIHPDPQSARRCTGPIRKRLFDVGIQTHLAGVDTDADVFFQTGTPSVTFTGIYRAKGNEAGMVYVINAQECNSSGPNLASLRNRLFTAITRSKAWVRIVGYGPGMQGLLDEFSILKQQGFVLDFEYPDEVLLGKLRIVHRDLSPQERQRLERRKVQLVEVLNDLEKGEIHPEDLDESIREKIMKLFGGRE